MTIWKFPLDPDGIIKMPEGAQVLYAREQGDQICLWAFIPSVGAQLTERRFNIYGTGHKVEKDPGRYVGSAHLLTLGLVFHVFEVQP